MKAYIQPGENLEVVAPYAVTAGAGLQVGSIVGIAQAPAALSEAVVISRRGVFEVARATGAAWAQGANIYWDNTAKLFTATVGSNKMVGAAAVAALSADTTGFVLLDGTIR